MHVCICTQHKVHDITRLITSECWDYSSVMNRLISFDNVCFFTMSDLERSPNLHIYNTLFLYSNKTYNCTVDVAVVEFSVLHQHSCCALSFCTVCFPPTEQIHAGWLDWILYVCLHMQHNCSMLALNRIDASEDGWADLEKYSVWLVS